MSRSSIGMLPSGCSTAVTENLNCSFQNGFVVFCTHQQKNSHESRLHMDGTGQGASLQQKGPFKNA